GDHQRQPHPAPLRACEKGMKRAMGDGFGHAMKIDARAGRELAAAQLFRSISVNFYPLRPWAWLLGRFCFGHCRSQNRFGDMLAEKLFLFFRSFAPHEERPLPNRAATALGRRT